MSFLTGFSNHTWWPAMDDTDTTAPSYWLNWRFLVCAILLFLFMVLAATIIWRYEKRSKSRNEESENQQAKGVLYKDDVWRTCWKSINPGWLLAYRVVAFSVFLALLITDGAMHSGGIFFFYTQWTFTLVTFYFGLGSFFSIRGCLFYGHEVDERIYDCIHSDAEHGSYVAPSPRDDAELPMTTESSSTDHAKPDTCRTAGPLEYTFQIIFQVVGGAVALTDSVFWLVIYPFFTAKNYKLYFLVVSLHSVNAVFLIGDLIFNRLKFPFFRIGYFFLWTSIFAIFQWIIHACVSMSWPYEFLDLSSPFAPLWYVGIGLMHLPCFAFFLLLIKLKEYCLSKTSQGII